MAFITTVQGAALTIIGQRLQDLDFTGLLLSILAFFTLLLGLNNERRLSAHMTGYQVRALQIESDFGLSLLRLAREQAHEGRWILSNAKIFPAYYVIIMLAWGSIWAINLFPF